MMRLIVAASVRRHHRDDRPRLDEAEMARILAARVVAGDGHVAGRDPIAGSGSQRLSQQVRDGVTGDGGHALDPVRRIAGGRPLELRLREDKDHGVAAAAGSAVAHAPGEQALPVAERGRHAVSPHGHDQPGAPQPHERRADGGDRDHRGDQDCEAGDGRAHAIASAFRAATRSSW
jgi:hypothetical protein